MEQEILSWLNAKYETGKETDFISKEDLWNEFANEREVHLSRDDFFTHLGRCISQSSLKEIKVTRCKGKRNGYKGLRKKQGRNSSHTLADSECIPSNSDVKERAKGEASETGGEATNELVQHLRRKNGRSLHIKQDVNDIARVDENDVHSFHSDANSQKSDKRKGDEDRRDDNEASSHDNLGNEQRSSGKERGVCQDNVPEDEASPLQKNAKYDEKESSEYRWDDAEVPPLANLEDGKIASEEERGICQEKSPEKEVSPLLKRGKDDKKEVSENRWCDAEAPSHTNLESGQNSSENERGVCKGNAPEEEPASLTENFQVDGTIFDDVLCATGLRDAEKLEWTDERSDIADGTVKSPKSNKRKPRSSSSSSSTVGFGSSKSRKRQTKRRSKRRTVLVSSDEEEHSPERFYQNHHKKLKSLLPKHLPNRPRSFRDFLRMVVASPKKENPRRIDIHRHSGDTLNNECALRRSFIAAAFPPIKVGQLAGCEIEHTFPGDVFPQFTHYRKSDYHCEVCIPFQRWAKANGVKHSALKSKQVTIDDIMNDTAILIFSGVVQAHEHFNSKTHQEAIDFFERDVTEKFCKEEHRGKPARKEATITNYFGPKKTLN